MAERLRYTYNQLDELTSETLSGTGLSAEAVTYSYDNAERLTGVTRYSNLAETSVVASTVYTYDHANRMTGIVDSNSTGTTLVSYGYTYDAANRVTQEMLTWDSGTVADTITYSYTNNNQLTGVTHTNNSFANESFTWDANGNETGTGYTTGTDNEQTASPGYSYTYDNAGNMTSETNTSTGDVWTYSYNSIDEMTGAVEKTSGGTTLESVTYTYDALGNRIGMDENSTQTWTLYDGGSPIMDFSGSGSLTTRYLWGPTGIVARQQTSGETVSWYLADALGSVRDLINNSGAIIDHIDFSAFGTVLDQSNPSAGDRMMGFAGMELDTVTGLNLAVFREENPGTGRWDSQDPLGFAAGDANLYCYAADGPSGATDPLGLEDSAWWAPLLYWPGTIVTQYIAETAAGIVQGIAEDVVTLANAGTTIRQNLSTSSAQGQSQEIAANNAVATHNQGPVFEAYKRKDLNKNTSELLQCTARQVAGQYGAAFGMVRPTFGPNFAKKVRKHIDQVRWRTGEHDPIPSPGNGGLERVQQIILQRLEAGGGRKITFAGEDAIAFEDGGVTYIFRPNGEFWTILVN